MFPSLASAVGPFHPVIVHVPIGVFVAAALLGLLGTRARWRSLRSAVAGLVVIGALSAILAALSGYVLGRSGAFGGGTFEWHQRVGIALAITGALSAVTIGCHAAWLRAVGGILLAVTLPLVVVAGHLGGTLTHGEGYLTDHVPSWLGGRTVSAARTRVPSEVHVYADLVRPILEARCIGCHGGMSPAGELRLDTADGIRQGGHSGPAIVAGRGGSSEMVRRLWLPPSHKDAMPPGGRHAPPVSEASLLRWWIDQGASFDATLADVEIDPQLRPAMEARVGPLRPNAPAILAVKVPQADPAAIAAVRALGVSVSPLADGTALLDVHCASVARTFGDRELATLAPLAEQVTWLALGGTQVTDAGLPVLSRFANLTRLHLDRTRVTDAGLASLAGLERLEYLNLYGAPVTDAGLKHLAGLRSLRDVYVWRTAVTRAGVDQLRSALPRVRVNLGDPEAVDADYHAGRKP